MKTTFFCLRATFAVCLMLVAFAACGDDKDKNESKNEITLLSEATEEIMAAPTEEGKEITFTVSFNSTAEWSAKVGQNWLSLSQTKGAAGENTISVIARENKELTDRETQITITTAGTEPIVVTVKQYGINAELVFDKPDGLKLEVDNEAQEIKGMLKVTSNYDWEINIDADWLSYELSEVKSNSVSKNVTFYADPQKLSSFSAEATVSFSYNTKTRAIPENISYKVRLDETPEVTFSVRKEADGETELKPVECIEFIEPNDGLFRQAVVITSNFKGSISKKELPDWVTTDEDEETEESETIPFGSANFFTSETVIIFSVKDEMLDTEELNGEVKLTGDNVGEFELPTLKFRYNGVDENFIKINTEGLGAINTNTMSYTFAAYGENEYTPVAKTFTIKTSNPDNIAFYLAKIENGSPVAYDVATWGGVELIEPSTRAKLNSYDCEIYLNARSSNEMDNNPTDTRYIALFVVPKSKVNEFNDLWLDIESNKLKPEYDNFIRIEQLGLQKDYTFNIQKLVKDGVDYPVIDNAVELPAEAGEYSVIIDTKLDYETDMINLYYNVEGEVGSNSWKGNNYWDYGEKAIVTVDYIRDNNEIKGVTFNMKENTGTERSEYCGFVSDAAKVLLCKLTINQRGKTN